MLSDRIAPRYRNGAPDYPGLGTVHDCGHVDFLGQVAHEGRQGPDGKGQGMDRLTRG